MKLTKDMRTIKIIAQTCDLLNLIKDVKNKQIKEILLMFKTHIADFNQLKTLSKKMGVSIIYTQTAYQIACLVPNVTESDLTDNNCFFALERENDVSRVCVYWKVD